MTLEKYLELAPRTMPESFDRTERIINCQYGLIGEFGEIVELLKKARFHGHELSPKRLVEECGDLLWYVANLAIDTGNTGRFTGLDGEIYAMMRYADYDLDSEGECIASVSRLFSECANRFVFDLYIELRSCFHFALCGFVELIAFLIAHHKLPGTPERVLDIITDANIEKLTARYPEGFSEERSRGRDN